ncbi:MULTISPECIES: DUF4190 domain-containing protein [unclassified Myroides]|uniref:DUF4190 domain-containing protein n=1 Tax=unclassified Myroides TaxID=2642485 RepID=UPI0015FACC88|nr:MULTISPECIES: DUF4190 domain-containing protein [unclassified Myroides]MBB1149977.1 DUF4190 domain-containing protein [Myroides sp. NP-2]MDM1407677.1 DUF4190 domain-containing protein [Myroides sp. DF42-4-2]
MNNYNPPPVPPQKSESNTQVLGILALVAGIIALPSSFIPCFGLIALIVSVVAIVLGILTISSAKKHNEAKGLGIAGLVLGGISFIIILAWGAFFATAANAVINDLNDIQNEIESLNQDDYTPYYEEEYNEAEDSLQGQGEVYYLDEQVAE